MACPWLIKRFVDPDAEFHFVPRERVMEVAKEVGGTPFDHPEAELMHYKDGGVEYVSFDAIIRKFGLDDPALLELARIVRGADARIPDPPAESAGLEAAAMGFRELASDDFENMKLQFPLYDALYEYCRARLAGRAKLEHAKPTG